MFLGFLDELRAAAAGGADGIRIVPAARVAHGRDMVDIDAQQNHDVLHGEVWAVGRPNKMC